jgi:hypothetical protein
MLIRMANRYVKNYCDIYDHIIFDEKYKYFHISLTKQTNIISYKSADDQLHVFMSESLEARMQAYISLARTK